MDYIPNVNLSMEKKQIQEEMKRYVLWCLREVITKVGSVLGNEKLRVFTAGLR